MARNIIGSKFDDYVKNQIERRQADFSSYIVEADGLIRPTNLTHLQNANTAYLKLTSGVNIDGELLPGSEAKKYTLFNTRFDGALAEGVQIGAVNSAYGWQSLTGYGFSPPPGLVSADIKSLNRGSLREATVKLLCHNITQFEIIDQLYLRLGYSMLLEWGWSLWIDNTPPYGVLNSAYSSETMADKFLTTGIGQLEILNNIIAQRRNSCGNYDAMLGLVKNYSWDLQHDGSYDITLSLVSVGDVIESLKTNTSQPSNYSSPTNVPVDQPPLQYNAEKSTLNKILWWLTKQLKAEDIFTTGKYYLQGSDVTADKIAAGIGLKPNQNNDDLTAQGEVIGFIFPELLGVKGTTDGVQAQYFMKLGFLLRCLQNFNLLYDTSPSGKNQALINIDFNKDKNFCFTYPRQGSLDPRVCLIDIIEDLSGTIPTTTNVPTSSPYVGTITNYSYNTINVVPDGEVGVENVLKIGETDPNEDEKTLVGNYYGNWQFPQGWIEPFGLDYPFYDQISYPGDYGNFISNLSPTEQLIANEHIAINDLIRSYTPTTGYIKRSDGGTINVASNNITIYTNDTNYDVQQAGQIDKTVQEVIAAENIIDFSDFNNTLSKVYNAPSVQLNIPNDKEFLFEKPVSTIKATKKIRLVLRGAWSNSEKTYTIELKEYTFKTVKLTNPNSGYSSNNIIASSSLDAQNNLFNSIRNGSKFRYDPSAKTNQFIGRTLNIYINMNYIAKTLEDYVDIKTGVISTYDFLDKLMNGVQHALGNINQFNITYDQDTNEFSIIDSTFIPGLGNIPEASGAFDEPTKFITHTLEPNQGSFIRDASVKTQLSNNFATTVTVGAQANGNVVGENATALSKWNTGLKDRIVLVKNTLNAPTPGSANIDQSYYSNVGIVQNLYSAINDGNITDEQIDGSRDAAVDLFNFEIGEYVNEGLIPSIGFLPINLELTMDGLSGIRIYESFTADTRLLPPRYHNSIQFITTGISHRIQNNDWTTTITSISGPKYDGKTVGTIPQVKTHNIGTVTPKTGGVNSIVSSANQQNIKAKYGEPMQSYNDSRLVNWTPPYKFYYQASRRTKDTTGPEIKQFRLHKDVVNIYDKAFKEVKSSFTEKEINDLGLNVSSGTWNYRANRNNASSLSLHSWGIAIDLLVAENPNVKKKDLPEPYANSKQTPPATFSTQPYKKFIEIMERNGLYSLGKYGDYDWQHFQTWPYNQKE